MHLAPLEGFWYESCQGNSMKNKQIDKPRLAPGTTLIDTHCHLDMGDYGTDTASIIQNAAKDGVTRIITVGIDVESSRRAVELANLFPGVWATVGIHPHNAASSGNDPLEQLQLLATDPANKIVGYGEIGLDFARNYAPRNVQLKSFNTQIEIAKKLELPLIIHDRDAHDETIEILKDHAPYPSLGVMHCFSGDLELAERVLDLGMYISIPGIVTFTKSEAMQQVAREIPLDKMVMETDGPFLAPVPYRGKTNKPEYLLYTAQKIAELRNISLNDVARQTTLNAAKLFQLPEGETNT